MKRYKFELIVSEDEYQNIRYASMRGGFSHKFYRDGDCLHISTVNRKKLANDLEKLVDFGATSAAEVLSNHDRLAFI